MLLFTEEPKAQPVTHRWTDPGGAKKMRRQKKKAPGETRRVPSVERTDFKPNPFRQPIGEPDEMEFRHMYWQPTRDKVTEALAQSLTSESAQQRFANCGAECLVEWSASQQRYRLRASYCRCRHCLPCMKAKSCLIAKNLRAKLEKGTTRAGDRFRFITLTLKHSTKPLEDQIKELYRHFSVLRRSKVWKQSQKGGAVTFECKLNAPVSNPDGPLEWHPHLHIISEGDFIRQADLANYWMRITGGSFKVDVRAIKTSNDAANYVAKYVGKGADASVWRSSSHAQEWVHATKGLRTCATFGTWRGFALLKSDPADDATDWKPIATLTRLCSNARAGSDWDLRILHVLASELQYNPTRWRKCDQNPTNSA